MIHNVDGVHGAAAPKPVEPAGVVPPSASPAPPPGISDVVEISQVAKLAAMVQQIPDIRVDLVQRIKAEIAAGIYETPERLEIALDKLLNELLTEL
ncbi:MAG: flagellar biosynthesis anti-sigma factor FlgM [Phycisphaerae bacterium]|nr:flagellar biosynthesis anti-sigma factor FlgM [Phycisphaerae bacterium]